MVNVRVNLKQQSRTMGACLCINRHDTAASDVKSLLDCIITLCKLPYTTIRSLVSGHQEVQKERQRYREGQKIKSRAFRVGCDIISTMSIYSTALNAYTRTHSLQIRSLARYHCASGTVCAFWTNFDSRKLYNAWE